MIIAQVVHRIATDPVFASQVHADPKAALRAAGHHADEETIEALRTIVRTSAQWQQLYSPAAKDNDPAESCISWPA